MGDFEDAVDAIKKFSQEHSGWMDRRHARLVGWAEEVADRVERRLNALVAEAGELRRPLFVTRDGGLVQMMFSKEPSGVKGRSGQNLTWEGASLTFNRQFNGKVCVHFWPFLIEGDQREPELEGCFEPEALTDAKVAQIVGKFCGWALSSAHGDDPL